MSCRWWNPRDKKKSAETFTFTPSTPQPPTLSERLTNGLRQNPYLLVAILAFVIAVFAYRAYQNRRIQKDEEGLVITGGLYAALAVRVAPASALR